MTGDGVNDTAALKKSDIGIAVAGATDAARSAADIVLLNPGLSVIVDAIIGSRKIFQRMKSYCIYSISMAVRTVVAFVILTTVYDWYFPTIGIAILAILNDGCMISISRDRVTPSPLPDKWNPFNIFGSAVFYGCYLGISTIILFEVAVNTNFFQDTFGLATLNAEEMVGLIYTQISVGGLATIFITRSYSFSFLDRPGLFVVGAFIFAQAIASVLGAYGLNGFNGFGGAGWGYVLVAWVWSIIWYIPLDCAKAAFRAIKETPLWKEWVDIEMGSLHPFGKKQFARLVQHTHLSMNKNKHKKVHDTTQQYYTSSDYEGEGEEEVKP
jgi:H+-transporting ATPase